MIFGALLLYGTIRFVSKGWVNSLYIQPDFFFGYLGFEWVKPLPENWMYLPFILLILASVGIILGAFYRFSTTLAFLSFTYIELLDKTNYLNHYYFVSLMCFILIFLPANRYFSIDVWRNPNIFQRNTRAWHIDIVKFQLGVVYFFAGIAKLNSDWLIDAQPLKIWLQARHNFPIVGTLLQEEWVAYAFSWTGCFYDLFIVFFLLYRKTRPFAYLAVVFFHLVTWLLFPIGVFPWVMIFSTLIFFGNDFHHKILRFLANLLNVKEVESRSSLPKTNRFITYFFGIYVLAQVLIPLRSHLYSGDVFWNEEGFRFSWRVMLMHKVGYARFYLHDPETGRESEISNSDFLTPQQEDQMATQPDMILQYAKHLKQHYDGKTLQYGNQKFIIIDPEIRAEIYVSLNGRPSQLFVGKNVDLATQNYNLKHREWVEKF